MVSFLSLWWLESLTLRLERKRLLNVSLLPKVRGTILVPTISVLNGRGLTKWLTIFIWTRMEPLTSCLRDEMLNHHVNHVGCDLLFLIERHKDQMTPFLPLLYVYKMLYSVLYVSLICAYGARSAILESIVLFYMFNVILFTLKL